MKKYFTVFLFISILFNLAATEISKANSKFFTKPSGDFLSDLVLTKSVSNLTPKAGSTITFTITVVNNGTSLATEVEVEDKLASGFTYQSDNSGGSYNSASGIWTIGDLAPNESKSLQIIAQVKGSGNFQNTAEVTLAELDPNPTNNSQTITLEPIPQVDLRVDKSVNQANPTIGSQIIFTITVKNNGPSLATAVELEDDLPNGFEFVSKEVSQGSFDENSGQWVVGDLPANLTATLKITAKVLEPVTSRTYENVAEVTQVNEEDPKSSNDSDSQLVNPVSLPSFSLTKTAIETSYANPGDEINYSIVLKNTGNVSITNLEVTDPQPTSGPDFDSSDGNNDDVLDVGESWTFNASYEVTQEDIDAGSFTNQVSATGDPIAGNLNDASASETVTATLNPNWSISKSSDISDFAEVGDEITYEIILENTGNVSIKNIQIDDPNATNGPSLTSGDDGDDVLEVGETWTYEATRLITQADLDAGSITNVVTARGQLTFGTIDSVTDSETDNAVPNPSWTITKSTFATDYSVLGEEITYSIAVENTGNVSVSNVVVEDSNAINAPNLVSGDSNSDNRLNPGETWIYEATYIITQSDFDNGSFTNEASVSGDPAGGTLGPESDQVTINAIQNQSWTLVKNTNPNPTFFDAAGQTISYEIKIENTGNVSISDVEVTDPKVSTGPIYQSGDKNSNDVLEPGEIWIYTASYQVTQEDVDTGEFFNEATASGTAPGGDLEDAVGNVTVPAIQEPAWNIAKSVNEDGFSSTDNVLTYEIILSNTGNVSISNVVVTDPLASEGPDLVSKSLNEDDILDVGETWTYSAAHQITQEDLDAGEFTNTVNATGEPAGGDLEDVQSSASLNGTRNGQLSTEKTVDQSGYEEAGEELNYTIVVTNTGNQTITNVVIEDVKAGINETVPVLAPRESYTIELTYTVTQADVDRGSLENTVRVNGSNPIGANIPSFDSETINAAQTPKMEISKTVDKSEFDTVGEELNYTIVVSNTGNITITELDLVDSLIPGGPQYVTGDLDGDEIFDVGEIWTFSAAYEVTQDDIDNGKVTNFITASGTPAAGILLDETDQVTSNAIQSPAWEMEKTATNDPKEYTFAGEVITYQISVTNTGNVSIKDVDVFDPGATTPPIYSSGDSDGDGILDVGETWIYTAIYTVKQSDIDSGSFTNTSTANGISLGGTLPEINDSETVDAVQTPEWVVTKTADRDSYERVGEVIRYTISVENTGNVSISDMEVNDPKATDPEFTSGDSNSNGVLDPGETWIYEATYTVTQEDINKGSFENTATATGNPPAGLDLDPAEGTIEVDANQITEINVDKSVNQTTYDEDGVVLIFTITVKNTGNVDLSDVFVSDDIIGLDETGLDLPAGEELTYTGSITVSQEDVDNGSITNTANVGGIGPDGTDTSDTDDAVSTAIQRPSINVDKSLEEFGFGEAGDILTYTIEVTNTGNVTLTDVQVIDQLTGTDELIPTLAPGESLEFEVEYTVTQVDVNAGTITNEVSVTSKDPNDQQIEDETSVTIDGAITEDLSITKTASHSGFTQAGEVITYSIVITNNGNTSLESIDVLDGKTGLTEVIDILEPSESITYTTTYTVTQEDVDNGFISNTATASGLDPKGEVVDSSVDEIINGAKNPSLKVEKSVDSQGPIEEGQVLTYSITVTNDGNQTITDIIIDDPLDPDNTTNIGDLAPGESFTYEFDYSITAQDETNGFVLNTATATGNSPDGNDVGDGDSSNIGGGPVSRVEIEKEVLEFGYFEKDQELNYTITVRNTGSTNLTEVNVVDAKVGLNETISLNAGQSQTFNEVYLVTQEDLNVGFIENTATVTAKDPSNEEVTDSDMETLNGGQTAQLVMEKQVAEGGFTFDGDVLNYTITVTNSGNVTIFDIQLTDPLTDYDENIGDLDPGETFTLTQQYEVTQADVDLGFVTNIAAASGDDFYDNSVEASADETVSAAINPRVTFTKSVAQSTFASPNDPLEYTITVTNTGNLTLFDLVVKDPRIGLDSDPFELAPGQSQEFTGTYLTTQDDLDHGQVPNTATLDGRDFNGNPISRSASITVPATRNPQITVIKTADVNSFDQPGDLINYQIAFTNSGNITINDPVLTDPKVSDLTFVGGDNGDGILQVGETWNYTASYSVTQEDIDSGEFKNTATGEGTPANGDPISKGGTSTVNASQNPGWTITKNNTNIPSAYSKVGEVLTYEIVLENVGNVSIRNVSVTDVKATTGPTLVSGDNDNDKELDVNEVWAYEATHVVTQADIDAGSFENIAKASGTPAGGNLPQITDSEVVNAIQNPSWILEKKSTTTPNTYDSPGDVLNYAITIENDGNVTISNVDIQDVFVQNGPAYRSGDLDTDGNLDVGEKWIYAAKYTVNQGDIDNESFVNTATATGTAAGGNLPNQEDKEIVNASINPQLRVVKSVNKTGFVQVGEELTYTITVTNSGNMTLTDVVVEDPNTELVDTIDELAPGESKTYTETYQVLQDDLNVGSITNTASAIGFTKNGQEIKAEDTEIINGAQNPKLDINKSVDQSGYLNPNDRLTYDIIVSNTGNVTIFNVVATDPKLGYSQNIGILQPGESREFLDLEYLVTQADVDAGQIINIALALGRDFNDNIIRAQAVERITGVQNPGISSSKSSTKSNYSFVGEVIDYQITIRNTGNVSFFDTEIVDPKAEITSENPVPVIDPFTDYIATAQHIVTQEDLDAGSYQNQATAAGLLKTGETITTTTNKVTLNAVQSPSISVSKETSTVDYKEVGDVIEYTFTIENTGNVTLTGITLSDPKATITSPNPVATLSPGQVITLIGEHVVTQADLDAGQYRNTASVTGKGPKNQTANGTSNEVIVPGIQQPSLELTKSSPTAFYDEQGDVISYEILVENTGNVTLTNIQVSDPKAVIISGNPIAKLAPGQTAVVTANHPVIIQDINAGSYSNTATAEGKDTNNDPVLATSNEVVVPAIQRASISLAKNALSPTYSEVDEIVSYEITVTNTGNVTVSQIKITDELTQTNARNVGNLDPGQSTKITVNYDGVTQSDLDLGSIPNFATAVGLDPNDLNVEAEANELVEAIQNGAIQLTKESDRQQFEAVDDVITYKITVTNVGNVTLSNITATDPLSKLNEQIASLAPGESEVYTTTIVVTQADLDNGAILNTASTKGFTPTNEEVTDTDDVTVTALRNGSIVIVKTPSPAVFSAPDTEITYTLTITNNGNLTLNQVKVNDPLTGFTNPVPIPILLPGQSQIYTTTNITTQTDVDNGFVDNQATTEGVTTQGELVNDVDDARIVAQQSPGLSVTKKATPLFFNTLGEEISYEIIVTNTGNVTLTEVNIVDPITGFAENIPSFAPAQSVTYNTVYTIQQIDVDRNKFINEVTATGNTPGGIQITDRDDAVVFVAGQPAISLEKTASPLIFNQAGDLITYTLTATNIGSQGLTNVILIDQLTGDLSNPVPLGPGESTTFEVTYEITQDDMNAGFVFNNANVVALAPDNSRVTDSDDARVLGRRAGSISIEKVADKAIYDQVGEEITYTLTITNTGNVTLTNVTFSDPLTEDEDVPVIDILHPGESEEVTLTYLITQEDIDRGFLVNEASAAGETPAFNVVTDTDDASLLARRQASIELKKTPQTRIFSATNVTLIYDLEVTNTGNVTLTNVEITDPLTGFIEIIADLTPGEAVELETAYTTTQADLDRGFIRNIASVQGITPAGRTVNDSDDAIVFSNRSAAITLEKTALTANYDAVGDEIEYSLTVTNVGNVTLTDVEVVDPLTRFDQRIESLNPGESQTFTTLFTVKQADLDRGFVENTAFTNGKTPANRTVSDEDSADVPAIQKGAIEVQKVADVDSFQAVGDVVTYTISVTNTGNVTLKPVTVKDPLTNLSQGYSSLAVGETKTITTTYTIQQQDLNLGFVPNTASAEGKTPKGDLVIDKDQVRIDALQNPEILLEKEADRATYSEVDEVITYTLTVTNTGNLTLTRVNVIDPLTEFGTQVSELKPGQSEQFTERYSVTQSDLDNGSILNIATAVGRIPNGTQVSDEDQVRVIAVQNPAIDLTKIADKETYSAVGEQISYSLQATNTGNVTLENVTVQDPLTGLNRNIGRLKPGESQSGTTRYVINQTDLDNGLVDNIARVRGTSPRNQIVTDEAEEIVTAIQSPDITLEKSANVDSYDAAGDLVTYTLTVTNSGNVTLENVIISDPLTATSEVVGDLAPGESQSITAEYTITQSDVDAGTLVNNASAVGTAPDDTEVEDTATIAIDADQTPSIELTKTTPQLTYSEVGQVITYNLEVKNTGNVTLQEAEVIDPLTGFSQQIATLSPGEVVNLTTEYTVTQEDIDNGTVLNAATVVALDPNDQEVSDFDEVTSNALQQVSIEVGKRATPQIYSENGQVITYLIGVENTGNVTLNSIETNDPKTGLSVQEVTLAPGDSFVYTTTYTITQEDMNAGSFTNTAFASAVGANGVEVEDSDDAKVTAAQIAKIDITKTANTLIFNETGEIISYSILVKNTGNVTLTAVNVEDLEVDFSESLGVLQPGEEVELTTSYTITLDDVNAENFKNTASVTALDPNGFEVADSDDARVFIRGAAAIELTKTPSPRVFDLAGEVITYEFEVINIGNQTLTQISLSDKKLGIENEDLGSLNPGQSIKFQATYTATQADLDAGFILNNAEVTSFDPDNKVISDSDFAAVGGIRSAAIDLVKTPVQRIYNQAGDVIDYTLTVTNVGNVTLDEVVVEDPLTGYTSPTISLAPGESQTFGTSYTISQADMDAGFVRNTAIVTSFDPRDREVSAEDNALVIGRRAASVSIEKTPQRRFYNAPGIEIPYALLVTNTGNVNLTNLSIVDDLTNFSETILILEPGESVELETDYTTNQEDVDRGFIQNSATVEASTPADRIVTDSDIAVVFARRDGEIQLVKESITADYDEVGDVIDYLLTVTNVGNVTLTEVKVIDPLTGTEITLEESLAPEEEIEISANYTVTQEDLDRGFILNEAAVTGKTPANRTVEDQDEAEVPAIQNGEISITKEADLDEFSAVGEVITYTITVTNTGNVTLAPVTVKDPLTGLNETISTLAPAETETYTTTHVVTQEDLDEGSLDNTATTTGRTPAQELLTEEASVSVPAVQSPSISLVKTADRETYSQAGEVINYSLTITNTGNVTLAPASLFDPLLDYDDFVEELAPGHVITLKPTYAVTQEDVDKGFILNEANVTGIAPDLSEVTDEAEVNVLAIQNPAIQLEKAADVSSVDEAGQVINYTITVTNIGNITLVDGVVKDPLTDLETPIAELAPGESVEINTTYEALQNDIDAGIITNTASVNATGKNGIAVTDEDTVEVEAIQVGLINVTKTANVATYDAAGNVIQYTVLVTNTGNVTLTDVVVTDPLTNLEEEIASLMPGESQAFISSYTILQEDVDFGSRENTAEASGKDPNDETVQDDDSVILTALQLGSIDLKKTARPRIFKEAGEIITYTLTVTNTGNLTLDELKVTDELTEFEAEFAVLAPGDSEVFTTTYIITQEDVDAGFVLNDASVEGFSPRDEKFTDEDDVRVFANGEAAIEIVKTASPLVYIRAGQVINYTLEITNVGTLTLDNVTVVDPLTGLNQNIGSLSPESTKIIQTAYTITQADVDIGSVRNEASVSGISPKDEVVTDLDDATVRAIRAGRISIDKTPSPRLYRNAGDEITYTIRVENPSNVTLTDVKVTDPLTGLVIELPSLSPGQNRTYTETYAVTQADVDRGFVLNTARVTATTPADRNLNELDRAIVFAIRAGDISITKEAGVSTYDEVGDIIPYTLTITNTGNVTLSEVTVTDPLIDFEQVIPTLAVGESKVITFQYVINQADLDAGEVPNTASVIATTPANRQVEAAADALVKAIQRPNILVEKVADQTTYAEVGEVITYTLTVTNTGNVTLSDVNVVDIQTGLDETISTLAPEESRVFTTTHTISQEDVDNGSFENEVLANGKSPENVQVEDQDEEVVTAIQSPEIEITKEADLAVYDAVGEVITYTLTAKNTGNVTLDRVTVTDPLTFTDRNLGTFAPGESEVITVTYEITQDDLDQGSVPNTAIAVGVDPNDAEVSDEASVEVLADQRGDILLTKVADKGSFVQAGEKITYTLEVTNTGNVTLTNVEVTDPLTNLIVEVGTLAPGESSIFTTVYTAKQSDLDRGEVSNTAVATGETPTGETVEDTATELVAGFQAGAITIEKTASPLIFDQPGNRITYTITVTNSGNVTLRNVTVEDPLTGLDRDLGTFAPGISRVITEVYTVTQADLERRFIRNVATARAIDPKDESVTDEDDARVFARGEPAIELIKTSSPKLYRAVGDVITYTLEVTNIGNLTLEDVTILDELTDTDVNVGTLAPLASTTLIETYTINQEDIDRGFILNTAFASGATNLGRVVEDEDRAIAIALRAGDLTLVKTADRETYEEVGEEITYTLTVTNTGNVTLTEVTITDPLTELVQNFGVLIPGESKSITTTYQVTQDDLNFGSITNIATSTAITPASRTLTASDDAKVLAIRKPAIQLVKTADRETFDALGQQINYTLVATNTGNVTLDNVTISDPLTNLEINLGSLEPEETKTETATYTVDQDDLDRGFILNEANVIGTTPANTEVEDNDEVEVKAVQTGSLEILKTADQTEFDAAGDAITYTITATNTGNVTLTNVTLTDPLTELEENIGTLAPGESKSITTTYTVTQDDLDAGKILNAATGTGETPDGGSVEGGSEVTVPGIQTEGLEILKTAEQTEFDASGDAITYTITATNTGNVTLSDVTITDPLTELEENIGTLAPGESKSITTTYTVTQEDVDAGEILNAASGTGETPDGGSVSGGGSVTVPSVPRPGLDLVKTADVTEYDAAGDQITYTITATNTGNVTLSDVTITDPLTELEENIGTLAPGESKSITTTYTVTQDDVDSGEILNAASGTGETPDGGSVEGGGEVTVPGISNPSIELTKESDVSTYNQAGDAIVYTLSVTNTGNVTLTNVILTDPLTGLEENLGTLVPGESKSREEVYITTQTDVDQGKVVNTAKVVGRAGINSNPIEDTASATVVAVQVGGIQLSKNANVIRYNAVRNVISYTLTATNTGNETLTDVTITDPVLGAVRNVGTLVPSESRTITLTYTISQADLDRRFVLNIAGVVGTDPNKVQVSDRAAALVLAQTEAAIQIVKEADKVNVSEVDEVITYTLTVTNTGNISLENVVVKDPLTGLDETIGELKVGESKVLKTTYTVSESQIFAQSPIRNTATASGQFSRGVVTDSDEAIVEILCNDRTLVTGRLLNQDTNQPISNVPVIVTQTSGNTPGSLFLTDANGRFVFEGLPVGEYSLEVLDRNLNKAQGLYAVNGNSRIIKVETCRYIFEDFPYSAESSDRYIDGFVWYDLNADSVANEWYDANNDGLVTKNVLSQGEGFNLSGWEWIDLNGDNSFEGLANEGELNRAGFGNPVGNNLEIVGPNGYNTKAPVGRFGFWNQLLPDAVSFGEFTITLEPEAVFSANGFALASGGLVRVLPQVDARLTQVAQVYCEFTTPKSLTQLFSPAEPNDFDYGLRCFDGSPNEIIANDDLFGEFALSYGGLLGNILANDILGGQRPSPSDVSISITDFGGLIGASVDANGDLVILPGLNPIGLYTLTYTLSEVAFQDNTDEAIIVISVVNDQVDLAVEKTSFEAIIYEGDEFEYEVNLSNLGGTDAREVTLIDDLPQNVTYLNSEVVSNSSNAVVSLAITGARLTWTVPFLATDATLTIRIRVKAGDPGLITNFAEVDSPADDINELNDVDDDVNEILPFHIPNVITPGTLDGDNDTFEIQGLGKFISNEIVIFNRWGDHVFETEDYQNDWDAPGQVSGTYFYVLRTIDRDGRPHEFKGWIQVIK